MTPFRWATWCRWAVGLSCGSMLGGLLANEANAQFPPHSGIVYPAPLAPQTVALPPLMYVRIAGPKGMKATFYRGEAKGETIETPAVVGLRPGYTYRIALSDVPGYPGRVFYPSLEVRASLLINSGLRHSDFYAALNFSGEDLARSVSGALIRKIIVLEHPDNAVPVATRTNEPLEIRVPGSRDLLNEAQEHGQPLVLVQLGQRELSADELAYTGVSGTVMLPGEKTLAPPRFPPSGPWACFPVGGIDPHPYICVPDGGDIGMPVGYGPDGKLRGLDPSDTVAEYIDDKGRKRITPSNRVCLCIPRYVITRGEVAPVAQIGLSAPGAAKLVNGLDVVAGQQVIATQGQKAMLEVARQKQHASGTSNIYGTAITGRIQGLEVKTSLRALERVEGVALRPEVQAPAGLPLHIIKWPDKCGAMIGDTVAFYLKFTNQGGQPISDVVIRDSLTPRFEYVPGSAKTDREALFTVTPNDAGSTVLRWEFGGVLQPHQTGIVSFQVRVR
jgi:uncharacterized repeat protein (TIGR01451 family)